MPPAVSTDDIARRKPVALIEPRGLSRVQAASYIGISPTKFDQMVRNGSMPQPKEVGGRIIWDRHALDFAFEELPDREAANDWDD